MTNFEKQVLETIKKYNLIEKNDKIVFAVSGGPDSIAMLDVIRKMCQEGNIPMAQIFVAHINHMIRKEATEDAKYVENYCQKNNIEFYLKSIDVQKIAYNKKIGTEEAGRQVRYEFFDEVMDKTGANKIAIAHNKNDRAETIIMNICVEVVYQD